MVGKKPSAEVGLYHIQVQAGHELKWAELRQFSPLGGGWAPCCGKHSYPTSLQPDNLKGKMRGNKTSQVAATQSSGALTV